MTGTQLAGLLLTAAISRPGAGGGPVWVVAIVAVGIVGFIVWKVVSGRRN